MFVDVCKYLEDIVLVDLVRRARSVHAVTEEGQAGQGEVVCNMRMRMAAMMMVIVMVVAVVMMMMICTLEGFVKVETEVGKDHPELLPPVRVLELSEDNTDVIFFILLLLLFC